MHGGVISLRTRFTTYGKNEFFPCAVASSELLQSDWSAQGGRAGGPSNSREILQLEHVVIVAKFD